MRVPSTISFRLGQRPIRVRDRPSWSWINLLVVELRRVSLVGRLEATCCRRTRTGRRSVPSANQNDVGRDGSFCPVDDFLTWSSDYGEEPRSALANYRKPREFAARTPLKTPFFAL